MLDRIEIVNQTIQKKGFENYLEIGVQWGTMFFNIHCKNKVAVDPAFKIKWKSKLKHKVLNLASNAQYVEQTSDAFFETQQSLIKDLGGFDIVFIDGLHTYEQVMKDIQNALACLKKDGVIYLHDCNPPSKYAAVPATSMDDFRKQAKEAGEDWGQFWTGDVWKAIVHLRSSRRDLEVRVFDCDFGVGMVRRADNPSLLSLSPNDITQLTYEDLKQRRKEFLSLTPPTDFQNFLNRI